MVRRGDWTGWEPEQLLGRELAARRSASSGSGASARAWRSCCGGSSRALAAQLAARPRAAVGAARARPDLVAESDVVTLHAPLSEETRHLVDAELLARFKPGSILVNTSRGGAGRHGCAGAGASLRAARRRRPGRLRERARGAGRSCASSRTSCWLPTSARRRADAQRDGAARGRERDRRARGPGPPARWPDGQSP